LTCQYACSERQIAPGSAMPSSRAAILTPSPIRSVALLDHIGDVDADRKHDLTVLGHSGVAPDHRVLHFDGKPHGVHCAAELDDASVAGAFGDPPVMRRDGGVDEVAAQAPEAR